MLPDIRSSLHKGEAPARAVSCLRQRWRLSAASNASFPVFVPQGIRLNVAGWRNLAATAIVVCTLLLVGCQETKPPVPSRQPAAGLSSDPLDTTFVIEGRPVMLVDGQSEELAAPNSSSRIITRIWGAPLVVDMDKDGSDDAVLILTQAAGGSGTFYYVVAAIATPAGYRGTAGIPLGDRIKPQSIDVVDSKVRIRYLTRNRDQSFADDPELAQRMDIRYVVEDQRLVEVAIDFEGEADPDRMTLQMHTWTWIKTVFNNDTVKQPKNAGAFTLTFGERGEVSGTTDCNSFQGKVIIEGKNIQFGENMAMTRKFCPDSQELEFIGMLQNVNSFFFTSRGQLIMEIKYDSGSMFFR